MLLFSSTGRQSGIAWGSPSFVSKSRSIPPMVFVWNARTYSSVGIMYTKMYWKYGVTTGVLTLVHKSQNIEDVGSMQ